MRSGLARLISLFLPPPPFPTLAPVRPEPDVSSFRPRGGGGGLRQGTWLSRSFRRQPRISRAVVGQGDRAGHRCSVQCKPQRIWCNKPGGLHETLSTSGTILYNPHTGGGDWRSETQNMGASR
ncbi:hypothetical protein L209DRAFT_303345 [Thermothelomyces heterothallicus CBS 203.75]